MILDYDFKPEMEEYMRLQYLSQNKNLKFYFCKSDSVKGFYKIEKGKNEILISNQNNELKKWAFDAVNKGLKVGGIALDILKDKESVTFYFNKEVSDYDVIRSDIKVNFLNMMLSF